MLNNYIKAVILDRDGTLIKHVHYLSDPKEVELLPGVKKGIEHLKKAGIMLFLHSNQSGVGRNYFTIKSVYDCNLQMVNLLGLKIDDFKKICIATEKPDDPITYRKPSPRFALEIIDEYKLKPNEICYMGDRLSDLVISMQIKSHAIGINTGLINLDEELRNAGLDGKFPVFNSFTEAIKYLNNL